MSRKRATGLVILGLAVIGALTLYLIVDRPGRRTYQETLSLNAEDPQPSGIPSQEDNSDAVTVYRKGRAGEMCYDKFHSEELHKALSRKHGQLVTVEFDTFTDFGKVHGYNVHSIDGIVLANGYHSLHLSGEAKVASRAQVRAKQAGNRVGDPPIPMVL
jgi:hypothetical protein